MTLFFMDRELMALMQDFHTLTGIRIALFDHDMAELMSYPNDRKTFCMYMRENPAFDAKCRACDERACALCRSENRLQIYRCHAGLTEAVAPITQDGRSIGYMMFGQVTEDADREDFFERMRALCESYEGVHDLSKSIRRIKHRTRRQILAAARILDAFTDYILLKEMIRLSPEKLFDGIERYIEAHLADDLNAEELCRAFGIGRTRLYEVVRRYTGEGIAAYIKRKRLERAEQLVRKTGMSIAQISAAVGFADYNYFLRVFKKEFGVSSKKMRGDTGYGQQN